MAIRFVDVDEKTGKVIPAKREPERPTSFRDPLPPKGGKRPGQASRGADRGKPPIGG